jgi:hypothetical protein
MADVRISVENGRIAVDKDKVDVALDQEQVKWQGNAPFTIKFATGPIPDVIAKQQGAKWVAEAGPFNTRSALIKYDIVSGETVLDPYIQVLP